MNKKIAALLILVGLSGQMLGQTPTKGVEGSWQGTLDAGEKLRLVLTVSKSTDGAYSGKLDSLDQGSSIPIEVIAVSGDSVRLELKTVGAVFEGKLNADRSELTGTFSQGGASFPLVFKRSGEAIAGAQAAKPRSPQRPIDVPVDVAISVQPAVFKGGGRTHLCYEMHITNFGRVDCILTRAEVMRSDSEKKTLAAYTGDELGNRVGRPGVTATTTDEKLKLGAGLRMVINFWLSFDTAAEAPGSIQHRLSFKVGDYPEEQYVGVRRMEHFAQTGIRDR